MTEAIETHKRKCFQLPLEFFVANVKADILNGPIKVRILGVSKTRIA